ncbi:DUF4198 domain-containing protein [Cognatishimia sp. SS12]|uniref:DUF4198 domain-containing protein n=1 Tax=Cognatishimia sp. SS12 TaxID=2979465 RepID=UPI0023303C32|nr:DUF4198 domain-containing protein [Cognatishimia sp. SS12]MDC0737158.1 DUF4198 domain-containing protein [Cognatishimia sp. SS12]
MAADISFAHEFWIDTEDFQIAAEDTLLADFRNGENFRGSRLAWFDNRAVRAEAWQGAERLPLTGRAGDIPAINYMPNAEGLLQLIVQTGVDTVSYKDPEKFARFVTHKDLDISANPAPEFPLKEAYTRHVKALIAVGHGAGDDTPAGLLLEFVALKNPYTEDVSAGMPVQLLEEGNPRANAQVEVFAKSPAGGVTVSLARTDADGRALIPVTPGFHYLLDAVLLRHPTAEVVAKKSAVWHSHWAALTFAVPD